MRRTLSACFLALACVAATAAAAPQNDALAVVDRWAVAFTASDVDAITNLYAADATFIGTSSTAVLTGHDAIRGYFARALNEDRPRGATFGERTVTVVSPREVVVTGLDTTTRVRDGKRVDTPDCRGAQRRSSGKTSRTFASRNHNASHMKRPR